MKEDYVFKVVMDERGEEHLKKFKKYMSNEKTLDVVSVEEAKEKISDLQFVGNGNLFKVLAKASSKSQGWMKSTKAMEVPGGCVVQVTTQQWDNVAEALTYVPGVKIADDENGGRKLVPIYVCDAPSCLKSESLS